MDFGALPPEVNSARIYSGPGSTPLLTAASSWSALAAELNSTASEYESVIETLRSQEWAGPSAAAMGDSVAPYIDWLRTTATQAEQSAANVRQAAAAYESAIAAMVPPPQIAANRVQLTALVNSNLLGLNSAAIAATEAQYGEMWTQDAAAMYSYAAASASAATVTPYAPPPQTTGATAAGAAQSTLAELISGVPGALQAMAAPLTAVFGPIEQFLNWYAPFANFFYDTLGLPFFGAGIASFFAVTTAHTAGTVPAVAAPEAAAAALGAAQAVSTRPVTATAGSANFVGKLSVPATWAGSSPAAPAMPASEWVSEVVEPGDFAPSPSVLGGVPTGSSGRNAAGAGPRYGARLTVMGRPPSAG